MRAHFARRGIGVESRCAAYGLGRDMLIAWRLQSTTPVLTHDVPRDEIGMNLRGSVMRTFRTWNAGVNLCQSRVN